MREILDLLSNPVWWFTAVFAAIVINLISTYLKVCVDKSLGALSEYWIRISDQRSKLWTDRVSRASSSIEGLTLAIAEEQRQRLYSIYLLVLGIFIVLMLVLSRVVGGDLTRLHKIFVYGLIAVILFLSFLMSQSAARAEKVVREAEGATRS